MGTTIKLNGQYEGETIEQKVARVTLNKEPIKDGAPLIYTDRKDGVQAQYDIRTDRFEIAIEGMGAVDKSHKASRAQRLGDKTFDTMTPEQQKKHLEQFPNSIHKGKGQSPVNTNDNPE